MKSEQTFIVDYAYGFNISTCEPNYVARARIKAGLRALKKYPDAHIILGAGMKEKTGDCGPLAAIMEHFLIEEGVVSQKIFLNPEGYDTVTETEAVYDIVLKHGNGRIICATSSFHAPRVWLIWLCRFGRMPRIYTTHLKTPWFEYLHEVIKITTDIARSLIKRIASLRFF